MRYRHAALRRGAQRRSPGQAEDHKLDARGLDPNVASIPTLHLGMVGRAFGGRGRLR